MLRTGEVEIFLNKPVAVGVPHAIVNGTLFYYYGILKSVDKQELKLETSSGFRIIPLEQVQSIHKDRRQQ